LDLRPVFGCAFASAFRFAAQKAFILSPCALRRAAVKVRFFVVGFGAAVGFASAFRFTAHLRRIRSEAAFLWAAENLRRLLFAGSTTAGAEAARGFFGGRPIRFVGP
jgi:hypothetical protein